MKRLYESKFITSFSIGLNIVFVILILIVVFVLFKMGIIPPFSTTESSIEEIPIYNKGEVKIEPFAENLEIPWDMEFTDDNTILLTERTGKVRIIKNGKLLDQAALDLKNEVIRAGEAGLMGIAKHPDFSNNKFIYLYHTFSDNGTTKLKISRYKFENDILDEPKVIFDQIPAGDIHSGGQMEFGPDGKLYVTTGDVGNDVLAQDFNSFAGKTLRLNDDGTPPEDNPFYTIRKELPQPQDYIYSLGHRNAQGLDWHPVTQEMYQSEHGPSGFDGGTGNDEINIVKRGGNYGWPDIRGNEKKEDMYTPLLTYTPAIAPASATFYDATMFPALKNKLLVGALRGNSILVISVNGEEAKEEFRLVESDYGRIRYVTAGPDGTIYFTTSNTDGRGQPLSSDDTIYRISKKD